MKNKPVRARIALLDGTHVDWIAKPRLSDFGSWEMTHGGVKACISRHWDGRASLQVHLEPHRPGVWLYFQGHIATVAEAQERAEKVLPSIAKAPQSTHATLNRAANEAFDTYREASRHAA